MYIYIFVLCLHLSDHIKMESRRFKGFNIWHGCPSNNNNNNNNNNNTWMLVFMHLHCKHKPFLCAGFKPLLPVIHWGVNPTKESLEKILQPPRSHLKAVSRMQGLVLFHPVVGLLSLLVSPGNVTHHLILASRAQHWLYTVLFYVCYCIPDIHTCNLSCLELRVVIRSLLL